MKASCKGFISGANEHAGDRGSSVVDENHLGEDNMDKEFTFSSAE